MQRSERKNVEVLAPAGNMDALKCAINNGADAVYLGLRQYNARAKAGNFTYEELAQAIEYAHFFGVRIYLTFNVLYKESEYESVINAIRQCHQLGADAFILQDFPFFLALKSTMPDIVVHLSTQAGVHNLEGAKAAEALGVTRIILSREATLDDIKQIRQNTSLEIECFVQGALCISFSGNCYFSSIVAGGSGNRGKCLQLCRKRYTFKSKSEYWLSPKDISLDTKIQDLIDAGVTSFKIEGRMRRPEYVGEAVNCYKSAINEIPYDKSRLMRLFNRGNYTDVYLNDAKNNVIYYKTQNHIGSVIGKVISASPKRLTANCNLTKGDGIKILRNGVESGNALITADGDSTTYVGSAKVGDEISITTDARLNQEILSKKRTVPFNLDVKIINSTASFALSATNATVSKDIANLPEAKSSPLTDSEVISCFLKTADYNLKLESYSVNIKSGVFLPKSQLNQIRRELCEQLVDAVKSSYKRDQSKAKFDNIFDKFSYFHTKNIDTIVQTDSIEIAIDLCKRVDCIAYFPRKYSLSVLEDIKKLNRPCLLVLPSVLRGKDLDIIRKILDSNIVQNVIVNNIGGLFLAKDKNILLGPMFNVINKNFPYAKIMSIEASSASNCDFVYYYGHFPIMTFSHCPLIAYHGKCLNCNANYKEHLIDEFNNKFELYPYRIDNCYCLMKNDRPINLTAVKKDIPKKFIDLIGMDSKMCYNIVDKIINGEQIADGTAGYYNKTLD